MVNFPEVSDHLIINFDCAVNRSLQTTTQDLSVFPFLPRHYRITHVLL